MPDGSCGTPSPPPYADGAAGALVQISGEGMILANEGGIVVFANAASGELLGRMPDELVGHSLFDLWAEEDAPAFRGAFARCVETPDEPVTSEMEVRHPTVDARSVTVRLLNRLHVPGTAAILVHVSDVRSDARADDEGSYRTLFEKALIGLGVADEHGDLLAFNDAMLKPGGYTRDEIAQLGNVSQLYAKEADRERVVGIAAEKGFVWREEVQFARKDGSAYDTLLTLTPVLFQGRRCWYATVEDVTEQRRVEKEGRELEAKLWQARKMEAVGNMTAGIAHDFNNILAVIMANADLLASQLGADATAPRSDLAELRAAAVRGSEMINKLMGFSRGATLTIEPANVADVVGEIHPMLRRLIPEDILLEVRSADRSTARCDRGAVAEMLVNLATNARDAMPGGGALRIAIGPAVVSPESPERPSWMTPGEFVRLSVSDTGTGMDDTTRQRALEPFFTTKKPGAGTGLGLSMVYGLAKQQGGFIDIVSEEGRGTTVHLYLPAAS